MENGRNTSNAGSKITQYNKISVGKVDFNTIPLNQTCDSCNYRFIAVDNNNNSLLVGNDPLEYRMISNDILTPPMCKYFCNWICLHKYWSNTQN
jgi:hypothetical protein